MRRAILVFFAAFVAALAEAGAQDAEGGPTPPCDGARAVPFFSAAGAVPATRLWRLAGADALAWRPPSCTGWSVSLSPQGLAALAGTFAFDGELETLIARIGSVSTLHALLYWSPADQGWHPMALDAAALAYADPRSRRGDFSASEFIPGRTLYYWLDDPLAGPAVYRMRILERSKERIVVASENVSPLQVLFFSAFKPGAIQAVEFIEQSGPSRWHVYLLTRIESPSDFLVSNQGPSLIHRLVAIFRRLGDIRTELEPLALPN